MIPTAMAASEINIHFPVETIFSIGPIPVTNSMILGLFGTVVLVIILSYAAWALKHGKRNYLVGLVSWAVEGMYKAVYEVLGDKEIAKKLASLTLTIFFVVLATYWCAILPGVGSITIGGKELIRELPTDLNFTFALALIALVVSQYFAIRQHGFFGNIGRYVKNPFTNPVGAFEGILEFVGEFSRMVALSLRLFGNAFAGAALLIIVAVLSGWLASFSLPFVMIFELFIGFIQAYVFFVLTLIFTSLGLVSHADSSDHSPADLVTSESGGDA